jgi:hypothetical protein
LAYSVVNVATGASIEIGWVLSELPAHNPGIPSVQDIGSLALKAICDQLDSQRAASQSRVCGGWKRARHPQECDVVR